MGQILLNRKWWVIPAFLVFAFVYPRFLIQTLGPANPWTNYLYLYGFGFLYTGSGIWLVLATGACNLKRPMDRFWFKLTVGGFCYFALLHALWIFLSLNIPYRGEM